MNKFTIYFFIENEWSYNFFKMIFALSIVFIIIYIFQSNPASWWNAVLSIACGIFSSYLFYIYTISIPTKNNRDEILFIIYSLLFSLEMTVYSANKLEEYLKKINNSGIDNNEKAILITHYNDNVSTIDKNLHTALGTFQNIMYQSPTPCIRMFEIFIHNIEDMKKLKIKNTDSIQYDIEYKIKKIKNMCVNYNNVINETISVFNDYDEIVLKLNRIREKVDESPQVNLRSFLSRFEV